MPIDTNPRGPPETEEEANAILWEFVWNCVMETYKSMPAALADTLLLELLGPETFAIVLSQMVSLSDVMPSPLYQPQEDDEY